MDKKIFFLIRDKLGDSLIAAQVVLAFRDQYPDSDITLMMRADYAYFLQDEPGIKLLPYKNSAQVYWIACWLRLTGKFDAMIVLRGFGHKVARLGKLIRAARKIHMRDSFPEVFPEYPPAAGTPEETFLLESMLRTMRIYAPGIQCEKRLYFPSLVAKRAIKPSFIGLCPITDEARKNLSPHALQDIIAYIQRAHPGYPIHILVRRIDEGKDFTALCDAQKVRLVVFDNTKKLLRLYQDMYHYYGADTGLYHLAAAMDIPATVFFGSSPACKIILPRQNTSSIRLASLGDTLCETIDCRYPVCLEQAAHNLHIPATLLSLDVTPNTCPLRAFVPEGLTRNRLVEGVGVFVENALIKCQ